MDRGWGAACAQRTRISAYYVLGSHWGAEVNWTDNSPFAERLRAWRSPEIRTSPGALFVRGVRKGATVAGGREDSPRASGPGADGARVAWPPAGAGAEALPLLSAGRGWVLQEDANAIRVAFSNNYRPSNTLQLKRPLCCLSCSAHPL